MRDFHRQKSFLTLGCQNLGKCEKLQHLNFMKWSVKHAQIFCVVAFNIVSNIKHPYFHFNPLFTKNIIIKCH